MSKRYPATARKYDMYLATRAPLAIGQVIFLPGRPRLAVREEYTREAWEAERAIPPASEGPGRILGIGWADTQPLPAAVGLPHAPLDSPEGFRFFYGADYI